MREFVTDKVKDIKPSGIRKFFDIASTIKGVISLGVGEPDFDTPWIIRKAAIDAINDGLTYYTSNQGLMELREAVSNYVRRKYDVSYDTSEILITTGSSEAIDIALRSVIEPGDEVITLVPQYVCYEPDILLAHGVNKTILLDSANNFVLTPAQLEAAISPKTKAILLNYPNNPTGATINKEQLEAICEVIIKHDLLVISDEIYSELTYEGKHVSIASIEGMKERTVLINGFSKAFAMTGWRLAYTCAPKSLIKAMVKIHQFIMMSAPTISQYAAIVALNDCDDEVEKMKQEYNRRRVYLVNRLNKMGLHCFMPNGAFYAFPCIKSLNMSSEEFCLKLLEKEKVVVVPGSAFGEAGEGFIRISYAYSIDDLRVALDKIEHFISTL